MLLPSRLNSHVALTAGLIIACFGLLTVVGNKGSSDWATWILLVSGIAILLGRDSCHPVALLAAALSSILPARIGIEGLSHFASRDLSHFVTYHIEHCFVLLAALLVWWSVLHRMLRPIPSEAAASSR
jgi:hypothetical protein